jgi:hypothetical protein
MAEVTFNLPHETCIFALQCAVEFVNGDAPVAGFENKPDECELVGDEDAGS